MVSLIHRRSIDCAFFLTEEFSICAPLERKFRSKISRSLFNSLWVGGAIEEAIGKVI